MRQRVGIGIIGSGFIAESRARAYANVKGYDVQLVALAELDAERGESFAKRYGVPKVFVDYRRLLDLPEVDMVDLCVPNALHYEMVVEAAQARRHVACAKPLTGYFGEPGEDLCSTSREHMLSVATRRADEMIKIADECGINLMYAENWVYAPSMQKARRMAQASGGTILEMRGGECHSGSHSPFSRYWKHTGGGSLIRLGAHAIGAALYLKRFEGLTRSGRAIGIASVTAETGNLAEIPSVIGEESRWIGEGWFDVENWASMILTFTDGSRATLFASDAVLGGMQSSLEIYLSNAVLRCDMTLNDQLVAYAPDPDIFASEYLAEKLETKAGWSRPAPNEEWTLGHYEQAQDFVSAVAEGRPAMSDGLLGRDVVEVVYAAYLSAQEGRRVTLADTRESARS